MSEVLIAAIVAVSASVWIYSKFYSRTGGNQKSALSAAALSGVGIFILFWILFSLFLPD